MNLERERTRRFRRRRRNDRSEDGANSRRINFSSISSKAAFILFLTFLPTASCSSHFNFNFHHHRRHLQGISIGSGTSLTTCSANLLDADANPRDESLSQLEFLAFVSSTLSDALDDPTCSDGRGGCPLYLDSDGTLWNGSYQTPITSFPLLPPELIGLFNRFACGNANYGCLNGIDVSGVVRRENGEGDLTDQEQAVLFRLCSGVEEAVEELGLETAVSTTSSTGSTGGTTAIVATSSPLPACPPEGHIPNTAYQAGDLVVGPVDETGETAPSSGIRLYYQCRDFPYTAWCSQEVYAPGVGANWNLAWILMGECRVEQEDQGGGEEEVEATTTAATDATAATATGILTTTTTTTTTTTSDTLTGSTFGTLEKSTTAATTSATEMATPSTLTTTTTTTTTTSTVAAVVDPDDPPYTGNLPVRFQYVIANTLGFTARTIPKGIETLLLTKTTDLVERVVTDTFGGFSGNASDEGDVVATMEVTDLDIDDDKDDDKDDPNDDRNDDGLGTARAHIVGGVSHDGEVRRQLRGFVVPYATMDRRHRKVQVLYEPGSVAIVELQDIDCPPPSTDSSTSSSILCQKVYCTVHLLLFDEPKQATELQFQKQLSRAIADGGIALPPETGVTATSSESALVLLPEPTTDPNPNPENGNDEKETDATSWQLPVIVTGAVAAALLVLPCLGFLLLRRKRQQRKRPTRKEASRRIVTPKEASLENDVVDANLIPVDDYPSPPRDIERGVDPFGPSSVTNDGNHYHHTNNPQSFSAEKKPNPFMDDEDNVSSYSDGSSSGSSTGSSASSSSSSSNNSSTSIESDYTESSSDSSRESSSTEDIHQNTAVQWTGVSNQNSEPTTPQTNNASAAADNPHRLPTVEELPDEDMSKSAMSSYMNLSSSTCDLSMYRAGVEALVKEACPDQMYRIEDMMLEYQGREQLLIGELSTMLAAKQRELDGEDDDDDDDDNSQGLASNSDEWSLNDNESSRESHSRSGRMDSTLSDSDMVGSEGKSLVHSGMTMDDENVYNSGEDSSTKNDADVSNNDVGTAPKSEPSQSAVEEGNAGAVAAGVAAGGAMAGAAKLLTSQGSGKDSMGDMDRIETSFDDSDSETSGWSSNSDGLSSMNSASFETSESSIFEITRASSIAAIAKASKMTEGLASRLSDPTDPKTISLAARDDSNSPNGAGTRRLDKGSDHSSKLSEQKVSRKDLDDAIEAGDWQAVGATAALLAHADVEDSDSIVSHRSYSSRESDLSSMEIHRASEIEKLVQEGDWEGIIKAATKYDGTSDAGERVSNVSTISSNFRGSDLSRDKSDIRTEVEELVCRVVPDEIDNVDEMMLQFQGREDELVETLKTMEERMSTAKTDTKMTSNPRGERGASPKSDSEGGNSFGASIDDFFSSPCEIFEGESAVGSIETPQGSVYSSHEKRSSEESTSTSSEIGDIVLDSGSEEGYEGRH